MNPSTCTRISCTITDGYKFSYVSVELMYIKYVKIHSIIGSYIDIFELIGKEKNQ